MGGSDRRPALPGSGPPPQGKFAWPDEELKRRAALACPCPRAARRPGQRGSAAGVGKRHHTEQEAAADRFCRDVLVSPACGGAAEAPIAGTPPRPQAGDRGPEAVAFDEWVGSAVSVMGVAVGSAASQLGGPANNLLGDMRVALFPEADGQGQEPVASQDITEFLGQTRSGLSPATGGGEGERVTSQDDNAFLKISGVVRRHRLSRLRRAFPRNISITHDRRAASPTCWRGLAIIPGSVLPS
jgi:hypothetical protein